MAKTNENTSGTQEKKEKKKRTTYKHFFRIDWYVGDKWTPFVGILNRPFICSTRNDAKMICDVLRHHDKDLKGRRLSIVEIIEEVKPTETETREEL